MRGFTAELCAPLEAEDYVVQSMPDASPTRWHLAHTTWFFETFLLRQAVTDYRPFDARFESLFNSYYNAVGDPFPRHRRGLLTRPTVKDVALYRQAVDSRVRDWIDSAEPSEIDRWHSTIRLGLHHEQQHQELILTDLKHALACNPLYPSYSDPQGSHGAGLVDDPPGERELGWIDFDWIDFEEGLECIGHQGAGFAYDNEGPRHRVFLENRQLGNRLTTNREFQEFIDDGGYARPELWLSAGWAFKQESGIDAPLYWRRSSGNWLQYTLSGLLPLQPHEPVCHVSYFEADAFARWSESRLPSEAEWEVAAEPYRVAGNFVERRVFHPLHATGASEPSVLRQLFGDVWEWTSSPYVGYPGFTPPRGAIGEYNGKFMCNQYVLRGGSCASSQSHLRATYRNFFPPDARWQFSGIRLAR